MTEIKSYRSPKVKVREKSQIQGKGVFAVSAISKGEVVFIKAGHIVDESSANALEARLGEYCLQIDDHFFLCPTTPEEVLSTAIYVNHSCEPNVGPRGQVTFVALRDIQAGEELCHDYAMTTDREYYLTCQCGTPSCRGVITGKDWKRNDLQEKYGKNFAYYILRKIENGKD
jgi:hypothetical protein